MKQAVTGADLIKALEAERIRRGLRHRAFSTLLGIHDSYWHRIRTGERAFNFHTLQLVKQNLPILSPEVDSYLSYITGDNHETIQKDE